MPPFLHVSCEDFGSCCVNCFFSSLSVHWFHLDREMSSGLDGSGGAQGEYLAVPVPNSAPYIGHASTAPVPGVYSTCSSLGGLKFKRNNAEQDAATTTSVVEATSMAQLHGVSRSSHDGIGTNESSVLDSDGVTISRESGENTSTTLVSRAQS